MSKQEVMMNDIDLYRSVNSRLIEEVRIGRVLKGLSVHEARDQFLEREGCATVDQYFAKHNVNVGYRNEVVGGSYYVHHDYRKSI